MKDVRKRMEKSLQEDRRRDYLRFCKDNYTAAVLAAQELFPEYYKNMLKRRNSSNDPWLKFNSKAQDARENRNEDLEVSILEEAVENNVDTPGIYERLAVIYSKRKEFQKAYDVCEKWFSSIFWKIPNAATTSLKLLDRMEKLRAKTQSKGDA